jgi:hypothetical protein
MPKKNKHPMHMTDDEAAQHLFHKDIVRAVNAHLKEKEQTKKKSQVAKRKRK